MITMGHPVALEVAATTGAVLLMIPFPAALRMTAIMLSYIITPPGQVDLAYVALRIS